MLIIEQSFILLHYIVENCGFTLVVQALGMNFDVSILTLDPYLEVAASMDVDVQDFVDTVNGVADELATKHRLKLQELAWIKRNYKRYSARRAGYVIHDSSDS